MKKYLSMAMIIGISFALFGCNKTNGDSQQTSSSIPPTTIQDSSVSEANGQPTSLSTANSESSVKLPFDSILVDNNNPIDKVMDSEFGEADTTRKISIVCEKYRNSWKAEMDNVAELCKTKAGGAYSSDLQNKINDTAQKVYNDAINTNGTSAGADALYAEGEIYKKATYYYIDLYKEATKQDYQYLFK